MRGFLVTATAAVALVAVTPAHAALNFDFSFTNTIGNVSGTVTGEIFGLTDNGTGEAATDIVIDSYPAGLTGLPSTPWDIFSVAGNVLRANLFTVSSGQITAADFSEGWPGSVVLLVLGQYGNNVLENSTATAFTLNEGDFAGATYTSAEAPEPASIALLLSGLFGLRMIRRRKG